MQFNPDQILKERLKSLKEVDAIDEPPVAPPTEAPVPSVETGETLPMEGSTPDVDYDDLEGSIEPVGENPLDDSIPPGGENLPMAPEDPLQNVSILDVLSKFGEWRESMDEYLNYAIKGSELMTKDLEREGITYITKDQVNKFATILESTREVFLSINDISFDSEKLTQEIDLSKKILLTKKEESVKKMKESIELKEGFWKENLHNVYDSLEELEVYSEKNDLLERWNESSRQQGYTGWESLEEMWHDNPVIMGSDDPEDIGVEFEDEEVSISPREMLDAGIIDEDQFVDDLGYDEEEEDLSPIVVGEDEMHYADDFSPEARSFKHPRINRD